MTPNQRLQPTVTSGLRPLAPAAEPRRWAAMGGYGDRFWLSSARSMSSPLRHAGHIAARPTTGPQMSPPLAGEAASSLALNCQPIAERATTTINASSGCARSRVCRLGGLVPALPARSQQSRIGVVFMACSRYLFASTEGRGWSCALLKCLLAVPPNHALERTRRQRAWLPAVAADRSVAPALLRWWRAAQRER